MYQMGSSFSTSYLINASLRLFSNKTADITVSEKKLMTGKKLICNDMKIKPMS